MLKRSAFFLLIILSQILLNSSVVLSEEIITGSAPTKIKSQMITAQNLSFFVGELKVFNNVDVERVAIGNGGIIKVELLPNHQLLLIAESIGSTYLHFWNKNGSESEYNIKVEKSDPHVRLRRKSMINMDVKIVEFRKAALSSLGVDWSKQFSGPGLAIARDFKSSTLFRGSSSSDIFNNLPLNVTPTQTWLGIATEITSRINLLASNGDATTLAEPRLSCRNGGSAKFLAGGEVPYPTTSALGQTNVEFKEYGIKLNVSPLVDDQTGLIATKILTEVSQIDDAVSVNGVPGLLTRRTETEVNVYDGETIVLAGLLNAESTKDLDKLPGLGDLPIIGWLFKSEDFRRSVTELVIFVTPRIFTPDSPLNKDRVDKFRAERKKRLEKVKDKLHFGLME
jgi:pilus assembly protein CpaC